MSTFTIERRVVALYLRRVAAEGAESFFFDNPLHREVAELAESGAATNDLETAVDSFHNMDSTGKTLREIKKEVRETPPTPDEILEEEENGEYFSTLSRLLLETDQ